MYVASSTAKKIPTPIRAHFYATPIARKCALIGVDNYFLATACKQLLGLVSACAIENGVSHLSSACKKSLLLQLARSNHEQYTAYTGQTYVPLASKLTRPVA